MCSIGGRFRLFTFNGQWSLSHWVIGAMGLLANELICQYANLLMKGAMCSKGG